MSTWQIIKTLARDLSFDKRKFLFFVLFFTLTAGIYWGWSGNSKSEAAVLYDAGYGEILPNDVKSDIVIKKNGDVTIDGKKRNDSILFYHDYDEFRLIAFDSPSQFVNSYQATVHLPEDISANVRQLVYAVHGAGDYLAYAPDARTLAYEVKEIAPGSTVTIVARLPKGAIDAPFWKSFIYFLEQLTVKAWLYLAVALPALTLLVLFFVILKRRSSQVFRAKGILAAPPSNLPPALSGVLIDGAVGGREIAATLIDLARRGYIMIVNSGQGQFNFGKRRYVDENTPGLNEFEKALLSKVFLPEQYKSTVGDVEMRIGRHIFSRKIANFYVGVYDMASQQGFFVKDPAKVHITYKYLGIGLFLLSFIGFIYGAVSRLDPKYALFFWLGGMAAAALIIRLAPFMPTLTAGGAQKAREWLAFREYLSSHDKIPPTDAFQGKLDEYLPYAVVLGVEVEWVKRFNKEPFAVPAWYESASTYTTIEDFAGSLFPIIGYVSKHLAKSHDPTTE